MKHANGSSNYSSYDDGHPRKHQHPHHHPHVLSKKLSIWWNKKRDFVVLPEDPAHYGDGDDDDSSYDSSNENAGGYIKQVTRSPVASHPLLLKNKNTKRKQYWDHRSVQSLDLLPSSNGHCVGNGMDTNSHPLGGTWTTTTTPGGKVTKLRVQKHPTPEHLFGEHLGFMAKQKVNSQERRVAEYLTSEENMKNEHGLRLV
mmetsp:Transcript_5564/g.7915  ORF Transcript_5564/g.7915 Transcript_5564/m.7915 type:complete len:200 (-) Transcript_5564:78-677(-)